MGDFFALGKGVHNAADVLRRQLVVVCHLDALAGRVDEQRRAVALVLLHDHDAGGDACSKKQVAGQLDHAVNEVVVDQILPDFLLRTAPVQDAGKADDGCRAVRPPAN